MTSNQRRNLPYAIMVISVLLSLVLKFEKLNLAIQGKHTWRQSMTGLNIRNFTRHDANIFNPRGGHFNSDNCNIRRMEFPLMQWSIGMIQKVLGERTLVIRLSIYIIGLISLVGIFFLVKLLFHNKLLAAIGVWVFTFFPVYFYQTINPIPDNLALCFSIWFLYFFYKNEQNKSPVNIALASFFLCLAALVKLPFILFGILPFISLTFNLTKHKLSAYNIWYALTFFVSSLPVFFWYKWVIPTWTGNNITLGIFDKNIGLEIYLKFLSAQLTQNIPQVVLNIPASVLVLTGIYLTIRNKEFKSKKVIFASSGLFLFILYIIFTLKQLREGHDYYFMPFLPLLLLVIVYSLKQMLSHHISKYVALVFLLSMPLFCWNKVKDYWNVEHAYFNKDFFEFRNELTLIVPQGIKCIIINDSSNCIVPYVIDKQGYIFRNDHLPINWIKNIIDRKVAFYLYSDSRKIESQDGFNDCIEKEIGNFGSIKVFKLKENI